MLVERHYTKGNPEIIRLCTLSKELYNYCTFLMRKMWFTKQRLPDINILTKHAKQSVYTQFGNTKIANQTIRKCLTDWSNYCKALKAYGKDRSKFVQCPKAPNYKDKLAQIIFYNETIKGGQGNKPLKNLTANNGCFSVPFREGYKQVVITPKRFGFVIEVQYESQEKKAKHKFNKDKVCAIDIGLNNLAAITLDQTRPILVNGRILKSINQWYNKKPCKSRLRKRYWRIENYFHHVSKLIVDLCVKHETGKIIIGRSQGWKQNINLGKKTNQNFCFLPVYLLLEKIKYKAAIAGIDVVFTEESYTSQSSFFERDPLPTYGDENIPEFSGERKKRGLYVANGFAVNADVNGSLNIGRKVIPEFSGIGDRSLAARPRVVNPLKT